jgi:riboflavin synthase
VFTGIVGALGEVVESDGHRLVLGWVDTLGAIEIGDSVAVNGVCLTITAIVQGCITLDVVDETLRRSNLGSLRPGDRVNLERPMALGGRLDGHLVQGHVDATGVVQREAPELEVTMEDPSLLRYVVEKGSITVDGVSLTVSGLTDGGFTVAIIPHTAEVTTLGIRRVGDRVNLEVDVLAKYVERLISSRI